MGAKMLNVNFASKRSARQWLEIEWPVENIVQFFIRGKLHTATRTGVLWSIRKA